MSIGKSTKDKSTILLQNPEVVHPASKVVGNLGEAGIHGDERGKTFGGLGVVEQASGRRKMVDIIGSNTGPPSGTEAIHARYAPDNGRLVSVWDMTGCTGGSPPAAGTIRLA